MQEFLKAFLCFSAIFCACLTFRGVEETQIIANTVKCWKQWTGKEPLPSKILFLYNLLSTRPNREWTNISEALNCELWKKYCIRKKRQFSCLKPPFSFLQGTSSLLVLPRVTSHPHQSCFCLNKIDHFFFRNVKHNKVTKPEINSNLAHRALKNTCLHNMCFLSNHRMSDIHSKTLNHCVISYVDSTAGPG